MQKLLSLALLAAVLFISACGNKGTTENAVEKDAYIRPVTKTVETYNEDATEKEIIEYTYEKPSDFFWVKAEYKAEDGTVNKLVKREFNEKRLPVKEITEELETVTETVVTKYCPHSYFLLEKTVYNGEEAPENKDYTMTYTFEQGYLISEEYVKFNNDPEFKNAEGTNVEMTSKYRYFPAPEFRHEGPQDAAFFVDEVKAYFTKDDQKRIEESGQKPEKEFKIGDLYWVTRTDFNEEGIPTHMVAGEAECEHHATEEWYKIEKDDKGRVIGVIGYSDDKMENITPKNMKYSYSYDADGKLASIEENRYNPDTKEFDKFHDGQKFNFKEVDFVTGKQKFLFTSNAKISEHYCYGAKAYSYNEDKIVSYDKTQKVVEKYKGGYEGEFQGRQAEHKLVAKEITKFDDVKTAE